VRAHTRQPSGRIRREPHTRRNSAPAPRPSSIASTEHRPCCPSCSRSPTTHAPASVPTVQRPRAQADAPRPSMFPQPRCPTSSASPSPSSASSCLPSLLANERCRSLSSGCRLGSSTHETLSSWQNSSRSKTSWAARGGERGSRMPSNPVPPSPALAQTLSARRTISGCAMVRNACKRQFRRNPRCKEHSRQARAFG
jgi:hypothetical protein